MSTNLHITRHGAKRLQNRAIPEKVVNWLLEYGNNIHRPGNIQIFHFNNRNRKILAQRLSSPDRRMLDKKADVFLVLDGEHTLITAGYRKKRLFRD